MRSTQQRFWPDAQPLVERLGRDFFRSVPVAPGVYLMRDKTDAVLYVGKAKSLRHRLASYRVANPERMARRTLRLLALVHQIRWEECVDEMAALRRESELLLSLRPRFNRAGVWQGPKRFLLWRCDRGGLELAVTDLRDDKWACLGIFGAQAIYLHRALVRLLWCQLRPSQGLIGMPSNWFHGDCEPRTRIHLSNEAQWKEIGFHLNALAAGRLDSFKNWLLPPANLFEQRSRDEDLAFLEEKFSAHPAIDSDSNCGLSQPSKVV